MIYKVYAQNVTRPIIQITRQEMKELIWENSKMYSEIIRWEQLDVGDEEVFDKALGAIADLAERDFDKYGYLGLGDFALVEANEMPSRPNCAGDFKYTEKDIIDCMNK